ncbi:hypothetical protein FACS1894208_13000 [Clostridia bacterium]|nr:hypothetical protein FACS1894208_13000 [Clostridia bacterium]
MDKQQTQAVLSVIKTAFPNFGGDCNPADIANLWARMFVSDDSRAVMSAAEQYMRRGKFPPTIADIRAYLPDDSPAPSDIWAEAQRLLGSGIAPDRPEVAYARMTPACKAAGTVTVAPTLTDGGAACE